MSSLDIRPSGVTHAELSQDLPGLLEGGADAFKDDRLSGAPPAAGQPSGVLMASPRTVSGRASAERGRGRSQRAYFGGGRLTGFCRDYDRPHATRPGPPAAAAYQRQSGDPDRIPAARRAQRPAHGRPLRESDRHHRAPGISCLASSTSAAQRQLFLPVRTAARSTTHRSGGRCCGF